MGECSTSGMTSFKSFLEYYQKFFILKADKRNYVGVAAAIRKLVIMN